MNLTSKQLKNTAITDALTSQQANHPELVEQIFVDPETGLQSFKSTTFLLTLRDGTTVTAGTRLATCRCCKSSPWAYDTTVSCAKCGNRTCPSCKRFTSGKPYCKRFRCNGLVLLKGFWQWLKTIS